MVRVFSWIIYYNIKFNEIWFWKKKKKNNNNKIIIIYIILI